VSASARRWVLILVGCGSLAKVTVGCEAQDRDEKTEQGSCLCQELGCADRDAYEPEREERKHRRSVDEIVAPSRSLGRRHRPEPSQSSGPCDALSPVQGDHERGQTPDLNRQDRHGPCGSQDDLPCIHWANGREDGSRRTDGVDDEDGRQAHVPANHSRPLNPALPDHLRPSGLTSASLAISRRSPLLLHGNGVSSG
jgi:hypothetical protein